MKSLPAPAFSSWPAGQIDQLGAARCVTFANRNSRNSVNIVVDSRSTDGRATAELTLEIADLKHLERVIRAIGDIEGVVAVERKFNVRHATA